MRKSKRIRVSPAYAKELKKMAADCEVSVVKLTEQLAERNDPFSNFNTKKNGKRKDFRLGFM